MSIWKIGDRVRMIHSDTSTGTVVSDIMTGIGRDGTDRVSVRWDRTQKVTEWNPGFLRPITMPVSDDPDELVLGHCTARRQQTIVNGDGVLIVKPGGFFYVGDE